MASHYYIPKKTDKHNKNSKPLKSCFVSVVKIRVCKCIVKCVTLP